MKNILLFGGSFNPMHDGHIHVAKTALKANNNTNGGSNSKLCFLPAKHNPFKKSQSMPCFNARFLACKQTIKNKHLPRYKLAVSNLESLSKHYETSGVLKDIVSCSKRFFSQSVKISWVMGLDSLLKFNKWKNWQSIVRNHNIIIVSRGNIHKKITILNSSAAKILRSKYGICHNLRIYNQGILFINSQNINISSTDIRNKQK